MDLGAGREHAGRSRSRARAEGRAGARAAHRLEATSRLTRRLQKRSPRKSGGGQRREPGRVLPLGCPRLQAGRFPWALERRAEGGSGSG